MARIGYYLHEFYLNVVGYKAINDNPVDSQPSWFYLNVVGYKGSALKLTFESSFSFI